MRRFLLLGLAALPLLGFDCGGPDPVPFNPYGCTLSVRGAVSEDLWCVVTVYDYSVLTPDTPEFAFMLVAYRGGATSMEVGGEVNFWLPSRAATGTAYGWSASASSVEAGDATRYTLDADGWEVPTHSAMAPLDPTYDVGTGDMSVTLTAIPAATAQGAELLGVHGSLSGTLPSDVGGGAVTFSATF